MNKRKFNIGDNVKVKKGKRYLRKSGTIKTFFKINGRWVYCVVDSNNIPIGSGWYADQLQKIKVQSVQNNLVKTYTQKFLNVEYTITVTPHITLSDIYWPKYDW